MSQFKKFVLILFLFSLMVSFASVQAQDEISTPTADWIYFWSGEPLYPEVVRFTVVVDFPVADLALAALTIQPEGQEAIEVPVSIVQSVTFTDNYTVLVYFWQIPPDDPLPLFTEVAYGWRIVTQQDVVGEVHDTFTFSDDRVTWIQDEDPDGKINLTVPADSVDPVLLRNQIRDVYDLLVENLGHQPSQLPLNIILYPKTLPVSPCVENGAGQLIIISPEDNVEIPCRPNMPEAIFRANNLELLVSDQTIIGTDDEAALTEFLFDLFYKPLWQDKAVPEWFRVGLAQVYLPTMKFELAPDVRLAARNNRLFSLKEMTTGLSVTQDDPVLLTLWRAQSYGMVVYLAEQLGVPGLFQLAQDIAEMESFDAAYQEAMGQTVAALLPVWENWIFRDSTVAAFGFSPYQVDTPTPPPTRTHTPFPPTITSTPTATVTDTPTATVTGFLSATPLPSRTSVPTSKPPTPSITPRPPGSSIDHVTPTELPVSAVETEPPTGGNTLGVVLVGGVFIVFILLIGIYIYIVRERGY